MNPKANESGFSVGAKLLPTKISEPMTRISTREENFKRFCEVTKTEYIEPYTLLWEDAEQKKPLIDTSTGLQKQKYNGARRKPHLEHFALFLDEVFAQLKTTEPDKNGIVTVPIKYIPKPTQ